MLKTRRQAGFTLVEAVTALAVLMAGVAGTALLLQRSAQLEREAAAEWMAAALARDLAEELRALRRPELLATVMPDTGVISRWQDRVRLSLPREAHGAIDIADESVRECLITIDWPQSGGGRRRHVSRVRL